MCLYLPFYFDYYKIYNLRILTQQSSGTHFKCQQESSVLFIKLKYGLQCSLVLICRSCLLEESEIVVFYQKQMSAYN